MIGLISLILIINVVLIIVNMITIYYNRKLIDAMIEHNNLERISQEIKKKESIMGNGEYVVIDYIYHQSEEPYIAFSGTYKECKDYIETAGSDFGYEIKLKSAM